MPRNAYPPESFDAIIIDECHRSIIDLRQNVAAQVEQDSPAAPTAEAGTSRYTLRACFN